MFRQNGRGRGGTAEIVRYAARLGVPIWWLRRDGSGEPAWIAGQLQQRQPESWVQLFRVKVL